MQSEIAAQIAAQSDDQMQLNVVQELCPGCDGRCGAMTLKRPGNSRLSLRKRYIRNLQGNPVVGQQVTVAVPTATLIGLSLLVYLAPVSLMLLSAVTCFWFVSQSDATVAVWAGLGLVSGLIAIRLMVSRLEKANAAGTLVIKAR